MTAREMVALARAVVCVVFGHTWGRWQDEGDYEWRRCRVCRDEEDRDVLEPVDISFGLPPARTGAGSAGRDASPPVSRPAVSHDN